MSDLANHSKEMASNPIYWKLDVFIVAYVAFTRNPSRGTSQVQLPKYALWWNRFKEDLADYQWTYFTSIWENSGNISESKWSINN